MPRNLSCPSAALAFLLGMVASLPGMEIRNYAAEPTRYDRFTGFPNSVAWNDAAWYGSRKFSGAGWVPADPGNKRQLALVSPLHFVCATHYQPGVGTLIRFLNSDGATVDRSVASLTPIKNDAAANTDLTLATLSSPLLAADKVAFFPYLEIAEESGYIGMSLAVIGWDVRAGAGVIAGFDDFTEAPIGTTRALKFDYQKAAGNPDDCYVEVGDSGSPTLALADGTPALVGTHSAVDNGLTTITCYDTFVPHYIAGLNAAMAPSGYQMTPAYPSPAAFYSAWAAGLSDKDPAADPDGDGISNMLEYAFGGAPAVASQTTPFGAALVPALAVEGGTAVLVFPVRTDAAARGLSYVVEFSTSLEAGGWSAAAPPGYVLTDAPFDPAVPGFARRSIAFDAAEAAQFCRVRVELNP